MIVSNIICCFPVNTQKENTFHSDIGGVNIRRIVMLLSTQSRMKIKKIYPFQGVSMLRFIHFLVPTTDLTVESLSSVMFVRPHSFNQRAFFGKIKDCNFRAPLWPRFFSDVDIAFLLITMFSFSKTLTNTSPVNEAIMQIQFIPQNEDMTNENKIWLNSNFVALCHWVGKRVQTDFIMPCLFMNFANVLSPEYLVMLSLKMKP
jgi:hypothetical protein